MPMLIRRELGEFLTTDSLVTRGWGAEASARSDLQALYLNEAGQESYLDNGSSSQKVKAPLTQRDNLVHRSWTAFLEYLAWLHMLSFYLWPTCI